MYRLIPTLLCFAAAGALAEGPEASGGITVTALLAEGNRADPVAGGSLDLVLVQALGPGALVVNIEGNTAVLPGSVPDRFAGADANAGVASLNGSNGTVQVSELKYRWDSMPEQVFTFGLLDTAAYLDLAATANDEKSQFLNAALVNNQTIAFPDYTLGLVWEQAVAGAQLFGLLTGSHGLGDTPRKSYGEVVDVTADGRGLFVAGGLRRDFGLLSVEAGAWRNDADHQTLDGTATGRTNYGAWGLLGGAWEGGGFDLRGGYANPEVNPANVFFSASLGFDLESATLGIGWAVTRLAPDARGPGLDEARVTEWYLRFPLAGIEATLDLQYLENPGFDATLPASRVGGVRLRYEL
jgi:hypothetical protein